MFKRKTETPPKSITNISLSDYGNVEYAHASLAFEKGCTHKTVENWSILTKSNELGLKLNDLLKELPPIHTSSIVGRTYAAYLVFEWEGNIINLAIEAMGKVEITALSKRPFASIYKLVETVRKFFPAYSLEAQSDLISMGFWFHTPQGPQAMNRAIQVPTWSEIRRNYPKMVGDELDHMMYGFRPAESGQLMLWHGEPGTGKTWALRAMAREWASWCSVEYVTDPEAFFGDAHYMMSSLLKNGGESITELVEAAPEAKGGIARIKQTHTAKWRLLIFEDSGELMAADAKSRTGQGLSRLLNVVDGLIGQGLRIAILVTTNEELKALHPAVARPGRCVSQIEFGRFPKPEAQTWLVQKAFNHKDHVTPVDLTDIPTNASLAELFAITEDWKNKRANVVRAPIGFGVSR